MLTKNINPDFIPFSLFILTYQNPFKLGNEEKYMDLYQPNTNGGSKIEIHRIFAKYGHFTHRRGWW